MWLSRKGLAHGELVRYLAESNLAGTLVLHPARN